MVKLPQHIFTFFFTEHAFAHQLDQQFVQDVALVLFQQAAFRAARPAATRSMTRIRSAPIPPASCLKAPPDREQEMKS